MEIRKLGFAGPANLPKLVYLTLFTGMLKRPVSLVIKGPSGAGKSYSLNAGKQFIPPSAYEQYEGMSEKALVYLKNLDLKHKHLVIGEAAGMAEGSGRTLVRQLLSEGKVRYATVQSTNDGLDGVELPSLEGPCGLIMTTTATGLHPEDESRMLSVDVQESPQQIGDALVAQALGAGVIPNEPDTDAWFALYEYARLGPKLVKIPFALPLAKRLPRTHDRIKRDFPQVLSLIAASALMHDCSREHSHDGVPIATIDDYKTVFDLVNAPLSVGLNAAVPESIRQAVETVEHESNQPGKAATYGGISVSKLADLMQRDQGSTSRLVQRAVDEGYLQNQNPGQGREARLLVGEREVPAGSVLPSPHELVW